MCELMRVLAGCTWRGLTLYRIYSSFYADLFCTQKSNYEWSVFLSFHMFSTKLTLLFSKGSLNAQGRGASSSWIRGHIVYHTIIQCVRSLIFFLEKLLEGFDISSANWKKNFVDFSELWLAWCVRSSWHFWDGVTSSQRLSWNMPSIRCKIETTNIWSLWWKVFKVFKIQ